MLYDSVPKNHLHWPFQPPVLFVPAPPDNEPWQQCRGIWRSAGGMTRTVPTVTSCWPGPAHQLHAWTPARLLPTGHTFKEKIKNYTTPMAYSNSVTHSPCIIWGLYQLGSFVVDQLEVIVQFDLLNAEGNPREAQLPGNVHPTHFHVHSNNLHGTDTSVYKPHQNYTT